MFFSSLCYIYKDTMVNIPSTHAEYRLKGTGSFDVLTLIKDAKIPKPRYNEVLVRIHAVSLNNRDLQIAKGTYPGAGDNVSTSPPARNPLPARSSCLRS